MKKVNYNRMEVENYIIRKGTKEDCEPICKLIQELADYERMPTGPKLDAKALQEDGFGNRRFFDSFVAQSKDSGDVVGYLIYFFTYSTWQGKSLYMEDVYVQPQHRRKGVGLNLLKSAAQVAVEENCLRLNFSVLNWNQASIDFYQAFGAVDLTQSEGWHSFRFLRPAIERLAELKPQDPR